MRRSTIILVVSILTIIQLGGCASGPKYSEVASNLPPIADMSGRIYFYRGGSFVGSAVQPVIRLNGEIVGRSKPGGFFYVDRAAGDYEVVCATEVKKKLTFTLQEAESRYVRTRTAFGVFVGHVYPILEDEEQAMKTLKKVSYTGAIQEIP